MHLDHPPSLDDAAGRLLLALLHLRDTGDGASMGTVLREYARAGRREDVDRASLEIELRTLYDAVFRTGEAGAAPPLLREGFVERLAEFYGRGD